MKCSVNERLQESIYTAYTRDMDYLLLLIVVLVALFITSQKIFSSLFFLLLKILRSKKISITLLSFFFFPGVVIHELSHAIMAGILHVRVGDMEFAPVLHGDGLKMGSVQIAHTDPFRRFLIGVAPLVIGGGILVILLHYFTQWFSLQNIFGTPSSIFIFFLALYGTFVIANTMFSSKKDMEGALALFIFLILILVIIFVAGKGEWLLVMTERLLEMNEVREYMQKILLLLLFPLGINIIVITVFRLFARQRH